MGVVSLFANQLNPADCRFGGKIERKRHHGDYKSMWLWLCNTFKSVFIILEMNKYVLLDKKRRNLNVPRAPNKHLTTPPDSQMSLSGVQVLIDSLSDCRRTRRWRSGVDGNWPWFAWNKPLHIHLKSKTSPNPHSFSFKRTKMQQHHQQHGGATDRLNNILGPSQRPWRHAEPMINKAHLCRYEACNEVSTMLHRLWKIKKYGRKLCCWHFFGSLQMSNQAVHSFWSQQKAKLQMPFVTSDWMWVRTLQVRPSLHTDSDIRCF